MPVLTVLLAMSFSHLLNDTIQAVIPAIYPLLKETFQLTFGQVGLITLTFQVTASVLQPLVGFYADHRPVPYSLATGMGVTLLGVGLLALAPSFPLLLVAAGLVGLGSSIFHPEASRVARLASGGKHGMAQSLFQVGGNAGTSFGPLLAAVIVVPHGQPYVAWFGLAAIAGIVLLFWIGGWLRETKVDDRAVSGGSSASIRRLVLPRGKIAIGVSVLMALIFSKYFYLASMTSYYTFYLIHRFHTSIQVSQIFLFIFLSPWRLERSWKVQSVIDSVADSHLGVDPRVAPFSCFCLTSVCFGWGCFPCRSEQFWHRPFGHPGVCPGIHFGQMGLVAGLFFGFAFGWEALPQLCSEKSPTTPVSNSCS